MMKILLKFLIFSLVMLSLSFWFGQHEAHAQMGGLYGFTPVSNANVGQSGDATTGEYSGQWVNIPSTGSVQSITFRSAAAQGNESPNSMHWVVVQLQGSNEVVIASSTTSGIVSATSTEYTVGFSFPFTITPGWYFIGAHYNSGVGVNMSYSNDSFASSTLWETNHNACIMTDYVPGEGVDYPQDCSGYGGSFGSSLYLDGNDIYFKLNGSGSTPFDAYFGPSQILLPTFTTDEPTSPWYVDCSEFTFFTSIDVFGAGEVPWPNFADWFPGAFCYAKKVVVAAGEILFRPRDDVVSGYKALTLENKFPFAYWYDLKEVFDTTASSSVVTFPTLSLHFATFTGGSATSFSAFSSSTITTYVGSSNITLFRNFLSVVLYLLFAFYVYTKIKSLFG